MSHKLLCLALGACAVLLSACQTMEKRRPAFMGAPADISPTADVRTIMREAPVPEQEGSLSAENLALEDARRDCARRSVEPQTLKVERELRVDYVGQKIERVFLHYVCEFRGGA